MGAGDSVSSGLESRLPHLPAALRVNSATLGAVPGEQLLGEAALGNTHGLALVETPPFRF